MIMPLGRNSSSCRLSAGDPATLSEPQVADSLAVALLLCWSPLGSRLSSLPLWGRAPQVPESQPVTLPLCWSPQVADSLLWPYLLGQDPSSCRLSAGDPASLLEPSDSRLSSSDHTSLGRAPPGAGSQAVTLLLCWSPPGSRLSSCGAASLLEPLL